MSEWKEWDFPPHRQAVSCQHGTETASRRTRQPVLDLHVQVTRGAAGDRKRSLYDRFLAAYLRRALRQ